METSTTELPAFQVTKKEFNSDNVLSSRTPELFRGFLIYKIIVINKLNSIFGYD